ncbi:MAG: TRAM domain-containing protein [Candidatus Micrarchaeia archaeon]
MAEEGPNEDRGQREERGGRGGRMGGGRRGPRREGMGMKPDYFMPKPVKVGDEVELTIESIAGKGDGIARKDNFVIFVKGTKVGDKVKVRITEVKARFAIGEIVQ